ncbi:MAG: exodeoxyribonuclease V subunit gamma, partial [Chlamydiales bacterium]
MSLVILSNAVEQLADALKEKLFFSGAHPFDRKLVIVPHLAIKHYLEMHYAQDPSLGIAAGVEFLPLSQALNRLLGSKQPTFIELTLQLENLLIHLMREQEQLDSIEKKVFAPLFHYLSKETQEKISALAEELARLFSRYDTAPENFMDEWKEQEGWQQLLWKRLYSSTAWQPLSAALKNAAPPSFSIYIFHFSSLPEPVFSFFNRCKATYFLFSPSPLFWGDLCSGKERASLHRTLAKKRAKQGERLLLEQFLDEQNPLFANLAKAGRDFQNMLLDREIPSEELFVEQFAKSSLGKVQEEIFSGNLQATNIPDTSIQVHAATSTLREIEILYDLLLKLMRDTTIEPAEILVLAPDISVYHPYIKMVFGAKESILPFALHDIPRILENPLVQGIERLLALSESHFDRAAVLSLFSFPPLMKKFGLTQEDLVLFQNWSQQANIHREVQLAGEGGRSWEAGFERFLLAMTSITLNDSFATVQVGKNEVEKLALLINLVRSLRQDLTPILAKNKRSASFWLEHLAQLMQSYFTFDPKEGVIIQELTALCNNCAPLNEPFEFQSVMDLLRRHLFQKKSASLHGLPPDVIRFGTLQEGVALPTRVICLLGMEEGAFPRKTKYHSLCALSSHPQGKKQPTQESEDRYLFLELLFAARDFFILTFPSRSPDDGKTLLPSLVVQELLSYLGETRIIEHPGLPSDPENFATHDGSLSLLHFSAAKAARESCSKRLFIPQFYKPTPISYPTRGGSFTVNLKELRKLAKNPLQFFFNKTLDLVLPWEEEENEFSLSALSRTRLLKKSWREPIVPLLKIAATKGTFPFGAFGEIAERKIIEEVDEIREFFNTLPLSSNEIWEVEWKEGCHQAEEWKEGAWILPPLKIPLGKHEATVVGTLSGLSPKGIIVHEKEGEEGLYKIWPDLLLFSLFTSESRPEILWLKNLKQSSITIDNSLEWLRKYLEYYEIALTNPSPLFPEWVPTLFTGTEEELEKKILSWNTTGIHDPYRDWLFWRDGPPSAQALLSLAKGFTHLVPQL